MNNGKYVIISPCRNEAEYMRRTLDTVVNQSVRPSLWVIVDDGSTDSSPEILDEYASNNDFIAIVRRENRGHRSVGPGVIEAFYAGYDTINIDEFEFACKLDMDLELPPSYFEHLIAKMDESPRLGTCSGKPYYLDASTGKMVSEYCGDENSIGASKFYRSTCFKQVGGFVREVMWDGIDGHRCRMLGWIASSWDEPELRFIHLRPMGSSQKNIVAGRMRHGFGQYFMGTDIVYMTVSAIYRMIRPPYIIGGVAMWLGYVHSWLSGYKRLEDPAFRVFLRRYQRNCLLRGKKKSTALLNRQQEKYWDPLARCKYSGIVDKSVRTKDVT